MLKDMLKPEDVHTGVALAENTKEAAIRAAAAFCGESGVSEEDLCASFFEREEECSTGCGGGIAIPHAKIKGDVTPKVVLVRYDQPIDWEALDDKPVVLAICLVMPEIDEDNTHLAIISRFARKLAIASFVDELTAITDPSELYNFVIQNVED